MKDYKFDIDLPPNTKIIRSTPYRVDYRDRQALKTELDKMLEAGVIYKSLSSWSHPIFLVAKKDSEEKRCVVNMKSLNKLIDIPAYPTPNAEDLMVTLGMQKPTIFTKIDIRSAYFQLMLTKRLVKYVASQQLLALIVMQLHLWELMPFPVYFKTFWQN